MLAFGGLVYGLSTFTQLLTGESVAPAIALVVGIAFTVVFVRRPRPLAARHRALLDFGAFRYRDFTCSIIAVVFIFGAFLGTVNLLPIYMQGALGLSTLLTGLLLLPGGVAQGIASPIAGRIYDAVGTRPLAVPGAILMGASQAALWLLLGEDTPAWVIVVSLIAVNVAMAMVMTPLLTASLLSLIHI